MTAPIHAFTTRIAADQSVPEEIQWMPPGKHRITAMQADRPVTREILVDARTATTMEGLLQELRTRAANGEEDRPYLDFNHDDREASGHVMSFFWGGDDPVTGGVRARVQWTEPGRTALTGRAYRRFSPSFFVNANGEVTGAPLNMGGLVNKAAFKTIAPIWSRSGGDQVTHQPTPHGPTMEPKDQELADLRAANANLQTQITTLNAKLAEHTSNAALQAKDAEILDLKNKIVSLETAAKEQLKVEAKNAVAAAVSQLRIPPQDTALQKHFEDIYLANPDAGRAILAKLPAVSVSGHIIPAGTPVISASSGNAAEQFAALVKAKSADGKVSKGAALQAAIDEKPELYKAWRDANGQPGL
jgi:phage I-like protein